MHLWIMFTLGVIFGMVLCKFITTKVTPIVGNWRINEADPEKDIFQIEFTQNPGIIYSKHTVAFKVVREKDNPHNDNI